MQGGEGVIGSVMGFLCWERLLGTHGAIDIVRLILGDMGGHQKLLTYSLVIFASIPVQRSGDPSPSFHTPTSHFVQNIHFFFWSETHSPHSPTPTSPPPHLDPHCLCLIGRHQPPLLHNHLLLLIVRSKNGLKTVTLTTQEGHLSCTEEGARGGANGGWVIVRSFPWFLRNNFSVSYFWGFSQVYFSGF